MAALSRDEQALRAAKLRLCRLKKWPNFTGLGFALDKAVEPPHFMLSVDSNGPAAAAGVRIRDVILAVNKDDTTKVTFEKLKDFIRVATMKSDTLELLLIEKSQYDALKKDEVAFDRKYAQVLEIPSTMPAEYASFPKNTPRTCNIRLGPQDMTPGFELITGERDQGAYVQDVVPGLPASQAKLRKSDRIIEVDDEFVDDKPYLQIVAKMKGAKANGGIKLYVMDTGTYRYHRSNGMSLASTAAVDDDDEQPAYGDKAERKQMRAIAERVFRLFVFPSADQLPVHHRRQPQSSSNGIRVCTIIKRNSSQPYGVGLNYDKTLRHHCLKIIPGANNEPSSKHFS